MGILDDLIVNWLQPYLTQPIWIMSAVIFVICFVLYFALRYEKKKLKSAKARSDFAKACLEGYEPQTRAKSTSLLNTARAALGSNKGKNKDKGKGKDKKPSGILEFYFEYEDEYEIEIMGK